MTGRSEILSVWVLKVGKRMAEVGAAEEQVEVFPISLHCALLPIAMGGWVSGGWKQREERQNFGGLGFRLMGRETFLEPVCGNNLVPIRESDGFWWDDDVAI